MSCIDKLSIMGIRSFDQRTRETIQFFSPLTLIVGLNGSGKTTIIECLKYATTGDLPPNSRNGAFIHDPNVCGEKDVYAQVKLSFNNTNGARMICTRSILLSVKKATRQQKTLDGNLVVIKNGERSSISSRCAELDQQIPRSLGVSRAVLDNVIFCHQEDSYWPLAEPGVLKKKFDEIFEALRYAKALDQIKSLRKDQLTQLKTDHAILAHNKSDRERARRIQELSQDLRDKIGDMQQHVQQADRDIQHATQQQDQLFHTSQEFEHTLAQVARLRHEHQATLDSLHSLEETGLELVAQDIETLEQSRLNFSQQVQKGVDENDEKSRTLQSRKRKLDSVRQEYADHRSHLGRAEAGAEAYQRQCNEYSNALTKAIPKFGLLNGKRESYSEEDLKQAASQLKDYRSECQHALDSIRAESKSTQGELHSQLSTHTSHCNSYEQSKTNAHHRCNEHMNKIQSFQQKISNLDFSQGRIQALEQSLNDLDRALTRSRQDLKDAGYDQAIRDKQLEIQQVESRLEVLGKEFASSHRMAPLNTRLAMEKQERDRTTEKEKTLRSQIEQLWSNIEHESSLESLDCSDIVARAESKFHNARRTLADAETEASDASRDFTRTETITSQLQREHDQLETDIKHWKDQILQVCDTIEEFPEIQDSLHSTLEKQRKQMSSLDFANSWFSQALELAKEKNCCSLCRRDFQTERDELGKFEQNVAKQVERMPAQREKLQKTMDETRQDLELAKSISPLYDLWLQATQHNGKAPQLKARLEHSQEQCDQRSHALQQSKQNLDTARKSLEETQNLFDRAQAYAETLKQRKALDDSVASIESEASTLGDAVDIEHIREEIQSLNEKSRTLKKSLESLMADRDTNRQVVQSLDNQRRDTQWKLSETQHQKREIDMMQNTIQEHQQAEKQCREEITRAETEIAQAQSKAKKIRAELDQVSSSFDTRETQAQSKLNECVHFMRDLEVLEREIGRYRDLDGLASLEKMQARAAELQNTIRESESQVDELTAEIRDFENKVSDLRSMERTTLDNIRYKKMQASLERIENEIKQLDEARALFLRDRYQQDTQKLKEQYGRVNALRAGYLGEIKQMEDQLRRHTNELNTEFKDADEQHRRQFIKVRTMEKANDDLAKYGKALDNAIMKFHGLKMDEVNRILDELWKETYCGTDVDSILIRSDNENTKGNRSYNYRVCMVKGDAELDMRGRCSAGQKVLASIIIRLALAECFSVHCGILCLDEPTTNLDVDNIQSLARSLARVVANRRRQANFQLVVITHDENFIRLMNCPEYCEHFYRVSRNDEQKSIIEMYPVADVL